MNRKIKFRYWNDVTKQMVNDPQMPHKKGWTIEQLFSDRGWVWMQFTGLLDRDGKEIYEGDILEYKDNYEPYKCVIEWNQDDVGSCGCCYDQFSGSGFIGRIIKDTKFNYSKFANCLDRQEIIGNVHENPDLIEKIK